MTTAATIKSSLTLDTSQYARELLGAKTLAGRFGGAMKAASMVAIGAVAAITTGVVTLASKTFLAAARVEELQMVNQQLAKVGGISGAAVTKEAAEVRALGIEAAVAEKTVAELMKINLDFSKASDIARIAQNAAVISGKNSTEATDKIIHGITTLNPLVLRHAGIIVDLQKGYKDYSEATGTAVLDMTTFEKQQVAMNLVMEAGTRLTGLYDEAMKSPSKQLRSLPRYINDAAVAIGGNFMDALGGAVFGLADFLKGLSAAAQEGGALEPVFKRMGDAFAAIFGMADGEVDFQAIADAIFPVVDAIVTKIEWFAEVAPPFFDRVGEGFKRFANFLKENQFIVVGVLAIIAAMFLIWAINAAAAAIATAIALWPIIAILLVIGVVAGLLFYLWQNHWDEIVGITTAAVDKVKAVFEDLKTKLMTARVVFAMVFTAIVARLVAWGTAIKAAIMPAINWFVDYFRRGFQIIATFFAAWGSAFNGDFYEFGETLRLAWDRLLSFIGDTFKERWNLMISFFKTALTALGALWLGGFVALRNTAKEFIPKIIETIKTLWPKLKNWFQSIDFNQLGLNISDGIKNGLLSGLASLKSVAMRIGQAVMDTFRGFFGINSPSALMEDKIGKNLALGLTRGFEANVEISPAVALGDELTAKSGIDAKPGFDSAAMMESIREELSTQEINISFGGSLGALVRELKPYLDKESSRAGGSLITGGVA